MSALGTVPWQDRPRPSIQQATDAIVRITKTTICATQSGRLEPAKLVTHHFPLAEAMSAYAAMAGPGSLGALKVILHK